MQHPADTHSPPPLFPAAPRRWGQSQLLCLELPQTQVRREPWRTKPLTPWGAHPPGTHRWGWATWKCCCSEASHADSHSYCASVRSHTQCTRGPSTQPPRNSPRFVLLVAGHSGRSESECQLPRCAVPWWPGLLSDLLCFFWAESISSFAPFSLTRFCCVLFSSTVFARIIISFP